ncbi:hypothetical protein TNIN_376241 [Trichonephila inaurata madagascariensis]|uniref:Uncharacterized protein n=1 Tax=Trichonephila inaurata madagascariensis TaxID=2747483 RepID=A0A8X7CBT8_9ARAC|nr:hypothetical protein TNIN_376241 [Trichonephila inaurata madagascariensis]
MQHLLSKMQNNDVIQYGVWPPLFTIQHVVNIGSELCRSSMKFCDSPPHMLLEPLHVVLVDYVVRGGGVVTSRPLAPHTFSIGDRYGGKCRPQ